MLYFRYSAVVRPAQYIEITEPAKRYAADIPAPLSQIDEPTEDVFKEEKEAALKKQKGIWAQEIKFWEC